MTRYCPRYMKVAFHKTGHREALFTRLRCKMWACDYCAKVNAAAWRKWLIARLPEVSDEWWLVTLTASRETRSATESLANIRDNLDRFYKRIKRVFGHIEFVRVYERHPSSVAIHAHIIMSGLTPYVANGYSAKLRPMALGVMTRKGRTGYWSVRTWFKKIAQECKMGYICDVKCLAGEVWRVALYACKYLTKATQDIHQAYLRHVQVSKGIGSPPNESEGWSTASYITSQMFEAGTKVRDLNTGFIVDNNYWETKGFYPSDD